MEALFVTRDEIAEKSFACGFQPERPLLAAQSSWRPDLEHFCHVLGVYGDHIIEYSSAFTAIPSSASCQHVTFPISNFRVILQLLWLVLQHNEWSGAAHPGDSDKEQLFLLLICHMCRYLTDDYVTEARIQLQGVLSAFLEIVIDSADRHESAAGTGSVIDKIVHMLLHDRLLFTTGIDNQQKSSNTSAAIKLHSGLKI